MSCPEHGRMLNPNVGFVGIWNPKTLLQGPASMQPPPALERPDYRPLFPNAGDFDFPPLGPLSPAWSQTTLHPIPSGLHDDVLVGTPRLRGRSVPGGRRPRWMNEIFCECGVACQ